MYRNWKRKTKFDRLMKGEIKNEERKIRKETKAETVEKELRK